MAQDKKGIFVATVSVIFAVAFFYAITGYLGLYLATPPGYATAIWIPSGMALAAVLIWGLQALPGIFLGSLIINFYVTVRIGTPVSAFMPYIIGTVIACGATLQAWAGWLLIKKFLGLNNPLNNLNDILLFAILSGPISSLVNATWSNTALWLLNVLSTNNYLLSWVTWWIGDSIGILIFTPLFLILFGKTKLWRSRIIPILIPLCSGFVAVILAYLVVESNELANIKSSFANQLTSSLMQLQNTVLTTQSKQSSTVQIDQLINQTFEKNNYYLFKIENITNLNKIKTIYSLINISAKPPVGFFNIKLQNDIEIQEQRWQITAIPSISFINANLSIQSWLILLFGLLFCAVLNIILFIINGQKHIAQNQIKEQTSALKNAESKNLQILNAAGEGIYGIDHEGLVTFINPAAAKMLGYEESEIIGKSMHELIHSKHADSSPYPTNECPVYAAFRHNKVHHVTDEVFWRKDGSSFWVDYTSTPLTEGSNPTGAVVVFKNVTQQRETEFELRKMAHFDILTSLPNRSSFLKHLSDIVEHARHSNRMLAVLFIDIDNFKQINDNLGHYVGDETLKMISSLLKNEFSKVAYFARLGGDEFGVILEYVNSQNEIKTILDRVTKILSVPLQIGELEIKISISIGVAIFPIAGTTPEDLIINADIAMYHAKESGKGIYAFFDEEISKKIKRRNEIDMELRQSLARKEFSLTYQLQLNTKTMQAFGIETLVRWHNKKLGEVSPSEFIPIAEINGLISEIGEWILRQACLDFKKLVASLNEDILLSVNISVIQLENLNFMKTLKKILAETDMPSKKLLLEITETGLMRNPQHLLRMMYQIKELGIQFALDDFGISYSSMHYLKNMPVSFIKIDQSFVQDILSDTSDAKIVQATIQLSQALGINTIAEGVENSKQFSLLKKMGCELMQGFYFAKPLTLAEILKNSHKIPQP